MSDQPLTITERRERLERKANVIRSRLLRRIDALDTRRHQVTALAVSSRKYALPAGIALVGGVAVVAGLAFGLKKLFARKPEKNLGTHLRSVIDALQIQPPRPSMMSELMRRVVLTSATILATEAARRTAMSFFDGRDFRGRLLGSGSPPPPPPRP